VTRSANQVVTNAPRGLGSVVCFGVHILDVLGRPVTHIPPGQQSLIIDEIRVTAAGTAAGTSVDLAKLGVPVRHFGAIGDDVLGDLIVTLLETHGVGTDLLTRKPGERSSATILPIRPNGERPALHAPGANRDFAPTDLSEEHRRVLREAAVLHIGGPDSLPGFDPGLMAEFIDVAKSSGAIVTMDVLHVGNPATLDRLAPLLPLIDWFLPNDNQLRSLTGCDDLMEAIQVVRALGVGGVAVTLGDEGSLLAVGTEVVVIPVMAVDVVDTTGCGDGYDAGFIIGLLVGALPSEAAWIGTVCGGLVATGLGSDAGIIDLAQVLHHLEKLSSQPDAARAAALLRGHLEERAFVDQGIEKGGHDGN